jgi:ubiquinol-cytochrome c reductase subunit 7
MSLSLQGWNLTKFVKSSPALMRALTPVANAFANAAGHRKLGLKYDDLIIEENPEMQKVGYSNKITGMIRNRR